MIKSFLRKWKTERVVRTLAKEGWLSDKLIGELFDANYRSYQFSSESGGVVPYWVHLFVTRRCNMYCDYCYVNDPQSKDPSLKDIKSWIDKVRDLNCNYIVLMGGEPTLNEDLIEIVKYCTKNKIVTNLPTNGLLLNEQYISRLGEAGIGAICLAVDGLTGKKGLDNVGEQLSYLLKARKNYDFSVQLNSCITENNYEEIIKSGGTLEVARKNNIHINIRLEQNPNSFSEHTVTSIKRDEKKVIKLIESFYSNGRLKYPIAAPEAYIIAMRFFASSKIPSSLWKCDAGKYSFAINNDGRILLCAERLQPLNMHILDLDENYSEKLRLIAEEELAICNKECLSPAHFCASYVRRYIESKLK